MTKSRLLAPPGLKDSQWRKLNGGGCSHLAAVTYSGAALVMLLGVDLKVKPALNNAFI